MNVSIEGIAFKNRDKDKITKLGYIYQIGERVLNGVRIGLVSNPQTGKPTNFLNSFATAGLYFQTGAWEKTNTKNVGVFWLIARYHICRTNPKQIKEFLATNTNWELEEECRIDPEKINADGFYMARLKKIS